MIHLPSLIKNEGLSAVFDNRKMDGESVWCLCGWVCFFSSVAPAVFDI